MKSVFLWFRRFVVAIAITLLAVGSTKVGVLQKSSSPKPVEVSREATSTAMLVGETVAKVIKVIDGDTVEIEGGQRVRYIGVDTPELGLRGQADECFAKEARDENSRLVLGKTVHLVRDVSDTDLYGRLLRYAYVGDLSVSGELVKNGFARTEPVEPDVRFAAAFSASERTARQKNIGLWVGCRVDSNGRN